MSIHFHLRLAHILAVLALAAPCLAGMGSTAEANGTAPRADYAFAQQKVYGMHIALDTASSGTLVGKNFGVTTKTAAVYSPIPGTSAFNDGLEALQAFSGPGAPVAPVENYSGNVPVTGSPPEFSSPPGERVLLQLNPTAWGIPKGSVTTAPVLADFPASNNFARADVYATPNPDNTISGSGSGSLPVSGPGGPYPADGINIPAGNLFSSGTGTLSMDSVAEALLTDAGNGTFGTGISEWVVLGAFDLIGGPGQVSLNFSLVERLIAFASGPDKGVVTASNTLSWDVKNLANQSVWGFGQNPSSTRILPHPNNGFFGETINNNTLLDTDIYPGPVLYTFQTPVLEVGEYTFVITGKSSVDVNVVPEPGAHALLGLAGATIGGLAAWRRRAGGMRRSPPSPAGVETT